MPLAIILRFLFSLFSWAILIAAVWLLAEWWQGDWVTMADGSVERAREGSLLWIGLALLAWSVLGGRIVPLVLAGRERRGVTRAERGDGRHIDGVNGARLWVEDHGPAGAPTLLLTHGWGLDSTIWSRALRTLTPRFRVITWDLPGTGRSKPPADGAVGPEAFAPQLARVVEQAGGPVFLVGHSIGGMTIQTLARQRPDLIGGTVVGVALLDTTFTNPLRTMILSGLVQALRRPLIEPVLRLTDLLSPLAQLGAWQSWLSGSAHMANRLGFGRQPSRSELNHVALLSTRNPQGPLARGNLAMFDWDAGDGPERLSVPTLVVAGEVDIVTLPEANETIARRVAQGRLVMIPGVNHMAFLEAEDTILAALTPFADDAFAQARPPVSPTLRAASGV